MADTSSAARRRLTEDEYLALERDTQTRRHEYVRGEIFAMTGTTRAHNDVAYNIEHALRNHVRGGPCRVHRENVQLKVEAANAYFYPDVFVTCDARDEDDARIVRHPSLIVEVLSDSTEGYNRGDKFADYRKLPALVDYLLVDSRRWRAEVFTRMDDGTWRMQPVEGAGELHLASVGLRVSLERFYEDTDVPQAE